MHQPTPEPDQLPAETVSFTLDEWETEVAAAEKRGYLRGRNEQIEAIMALPGYFQPAQLNPTADS